MCFLAAKRSVYSHWPPLPCVQSLHVHDAPGQPEHWHLPFGQQCCWSGQQHLCTPQRVSRHQPPRAFSEREQKKNARAVCTTSARAPLRRARHNLRVGVRAAALTSGGVAAGLARAVHSNVSRAHSAKGKPTRLPGCARRPSCAEQQCVGNNCHIGSPARVGAGTAAERTLLALRELERNETLGGDEHNNGKKKNVGNHNAKVD